MEKNKWTSTSSVAIVLATITMLAIKWLSYPELSYWIVFAPVLTLMAVFVLTLVFSIIIGSIAYIFKKDKIGERKKTLEDAKEELRKKLND